MTILLPTVADSVIQLTGQDHCKPIPRCHHVGCLRVPRAKHGKQCTDEMNTCSGNITYLLMPIAPSGA